MPALSMALVTSSKHFHVKGNILTPPLDQNCNCQRKYFLGFSVPFQKCTHSDSTTTDPDDLLKHFDIANYPEEHTLIQNMYTDTENEYIDLCDGTRGNLLVLPDDVFHYSKDNTTLHIQSALERINELEIQINTDELLDENTITLAEKDKKKWTNSKKNTLQIPRMV